MSKFTTTLKGLMALALGSFAQYAVGQNYTSVKDVAGATHVSAIPGESDNRAVYIIQSQSRGGLYGDTEHMQITHCGVKEDEPAFTNGFKWHNDVEANGTSENQQFAIITFDGKKYLYSVAGQGFACYQAVPNSVGKVVINTQNPNNCVLTMRAADADNIHYFVMAISGFVLNNSGGYDADSYKGIVLSGSGTSVDAGNRYNLQKLNDVTLTDEQYNTAINIIKGAVDAKRTEQLERLSAIKAFYHNSSEIDRYIELVNNAQTENEINQLVETVFSTLNNKLVYLSYAPRSGETDYKYLGVTATGDIRQAQLLPQRGNRAKWQLQRVAGTYYFYLRNIASDTHVGQGSNGQTYAGADQNQYFKFEFKKSDTDNAVALKYHDTQLCLTVNTTTNNLTHSSKTQVDGKEQYQLAANAWHVEPVGVDALELMTISSDGEYFVIRNNRGLTGTTYGYAYPGSLLGVYTTDREKARANQNLPTGVHLRQYMTGMQTIWKIVPQTEGGYKIYSIIGENADGTPLLGMHFDGNSKVTLTEDPTTIYIRPISQWDFTGIVTSPFPNGMALSSDPTNVSDNNCFDVPNHWDSSKQSDFYVNANEYRPNGDNKTTDLGSVFYIERVSEYDVEQAKAAFVDYAKNNRMFELLKNVLSAEEQAAALVEKNTTATINDVAAARNYLNEGVHAASTLAFEMLDGKVVRFTNRGNAGYYMCLNHDNNSDVYAYNTNVDNDLNNLWRIEVVNAGLRQVRFINYMTNKYVGALPTNNQTPYALVDSKDNAGVYTLTRYYSLDGKSFYMNILTQSATNNVQNAMQDSSYWGHKVLSWIHSDLQSHWTMVPAFADEVKTAAVQMSVATDNNSIIIEAPEGATSFAKTEGLGEHHQVKLTPVVAQAEEGINAQAEAVEVVIPNDKVAVDGNRYVIDLTALDERPATSKYTLNFPTGYFTVNGKLAPAMSSELNVVDTTGIREVNAAEKTGATVIYDLQGRRVSKASKGVYIINGVKTLVK